MNPLQKPTHAPLSSYRYQLEFHFDADVPCQVTVYYLAEESKDPATGRLRYAPRFPPEDDWVVGPHHFGAGANQPYSTAAVGHEGADLGSKVLAGAESPHLIYVVIRPDGLGGAGVCNRAGVCV